MSAYECIFTNSLTTVNAKRVAINRSLKFLTSHTDTRTDTELLTAYKASANVEIIGTLFQRYVHLVYGLCLKYLKDRDEAQDAVMEVFESLQAKLLHHEVQHFKSWLYMVSKNHCLMHLRKHTPTEKMNGTLVENELVMHPQEEERPIDEDLNALEKCLEQLKDDQQQCVRLFYLQQHSYDEVSQLTSFALKKVKSYIQNGKRNLKICLEKKHVGQ